MTGTTCDSEARASASLKLIQANFGDPAAEPRDSEARASASLKPSTAVRICITSAGDSEARASASLKHPGIVPDYAGHGQVIPRHAPRPH